MIEWLLNLFRFQDPNKKLKENVEKYEANRKIHCN